jgi:nucleoside-diphosphate-sugar epimerase
MTTTIRRSRKRGWRGFFRIRTTPTCASIWRTRHAIEEAFVKGKPQRVVNLAAQAGVRYSLENPLAYINSNIVGFTHILEGCRHHGVEHLVYASSSSVYGANTRCHFPFTRTSIIR